MTMDGGIAIVAPYGGGWILETLAREVEAHTRRRVRRITHAKGRTGEAVDEALVCGASAIVFAHHIPFQHYVERGGTAHKILFFGHYYEHPTFGDAPQVDTLAATLGQADRVWTNAALWDAWLTNLGVEPSRLKRIVRAVDSDVFRPAPSVVIRKRAVIGLASQYHHRKNEAFILRAVERRRDVDWVLLGRGWEKGQVGLIERAAGLPSFRYFDTTTFGFEAWPAFYRSLDFFLSPSFCEGGPFPMLEAMASGVWPLCSRTGFAEDFIVQGEAGHVFDVDDDAAFDACLDAALALHRDPNALRATVAPWTWSRFGDSAAADLEVLLGAV